MQGVPARVIPMGLWHTASLGLEVWLSAVAYGARQIMVLLTEEEAPQYKTMLGEQTALAQALLSGLGYRGVHFEIIVAAHPQRFIGAASIDPTSRKGACETISAAVQAPT